MHKAISINGGLGRVVCSLPALQKANSLVITNGWEELYALTDLNCVESGSSIIGQMLKGLDVIVPEPYYQAGYRQGSYNMVDAFHLDCGTTTEDGDEPFYGLVPDMSATVHVLNQLAQAGRKDEPIVAIQVVASGLANVRNLNKDTTLNAVAAAREMGMFPVIVGDERIGFDIDCCMLRNTSVTEFVSVIGACSIFIGGDSAGMHIARALNKPGIIYLTSTSGTKYYPDHFVEFRHPKFQENFEYPRLFAAEQRQMKRNARIGVNHYFISKDDFLKVLDKIRG